MKSLGKVNPIIGVLVVIALVGALLAVFWPGSGQTQVTADFPRSVSLYEGSDVKILGVPVGKVDTVTPAGTSVRVKLHFDSQYKVPADAKAVIISPSIVGDRFVQLTPAYTGGQVMRSGTTLGMDRTATPLELDQIFGSLNTLTKALGPDGANKVDAGGVGPLTRLLDSTARNLGGQGVQINKTLKNFGALTKTLADNKDALFSSLSKVENFTNTLATNDKTVRDFNDSLASGANLLAGERQELAAVLKNLATAMVEIRRFVKDNRSSLTRNISGLNKISGTLVKRRTQLDEILRVAPGALNNLFLAGNVHNGTLDVRDNTGELFNQLRQNPAAVLCTLTGQGPNTAACKALTSVLGNKTLTDVLGSKSLPTGNGRAAALSGSTSSGPRTVEPVDRSLGGLLEVQR
ncbi:MCE family protein [Nocardioides korecus]